jgi:hypothetical protein
MMKTGFPSKTRSRDKPDLEAILRQFSQTPTGYKPGATQANSTSVD